jgi:hypothetical protein
MPLISMYERDNSRVAYRLLASRAVEMMKADSGEVDDVDRVPLVNLARLLEHYQYDDFSDHNPAGILDAVATKRLRTTASVSVAGHGSRFEDLRTSLDRARTATFGEKPKEEVVRYLQAVLAFLSKGSTDNRTVPTAQIRDAQRFFKTLAEGLGAESGDG